MQMYGDQLAQIHHGFPILNGFKSQVSGWKVEVPSSEFRVEERSSESSPLTIEVAPMDALRFPKMKKAPGAGRFP
jgi:hypothetical protein